MDRQGDIKISVSFDSSRSFSLFMYIYVSVTLQLFGVWPNYCKPTWTTCQVVARRRWSGRRTCGGSTRSRAAAALEPSTATTSCTPIWPSMYRLFAYRSLLFQIFASSSSIPILSFAPNATKPPLCYVNRMSVRLVASTPTTWLSTRRPTSGIKSVAVPSLNAPSATDRLQVHLFRVLSNILHIPPSYCIFLS